MSYEQALIQSEENALENREFVSNVNTPKFTSNGIIHGLTAKKSGPIIAILGGILLIVGAIFISQFDEEIPSLFNDLILEATDVQKADHIESSKIAFQTAMREGDIPNNTAKLLKEKEYLVGYLDQNGNFIENNQSKQPTILKKGGQIITADEFITETNEKRNVDLYKAFKYASYDEGAYYFDDAAEDVFQDINVSRNEFKNENVTFDSAINDKLNTKNININNVERKEETKVDDEGNEYTVITYEKRGNDANTKSSTAESIIEEVVNKNLADTSTEATLMAADELKVADTISKERRSMSFYATFMENISKMKAGKGQDSRINEAMNFLYDKTVNRVVDVKTGQVIEVKGSPIDSPSLNSILMGKKVNVSDVTNYSSDRILTMTKNNLNLAQASNTTVQNTNVINTTVASVSQSVSSIGRLIQSGTELATTAVLAPLAPTISSSLIKSSVDNMNGIAAGEFLVEGAVNLGRNLAVHGSGATAGDTQSILAYQQLNSQIIAMDAAADRLDRSPFDITSKNTFLGSILYKFATTIRTSSIFSSISTISSLAGKSLLALFPSAHATEEATNYLSTFGQCETYSTIGAVGTAQCSSIATFDTSTLDDPYNNQEYIQFLNENTILENGTRTIKPGSYLANFIDYNNNRKTPLATTDGGILRSLRTGGTYIPFISNIKNLISLFMDASESELRIATGAAFVNSANNPDWQNYKYAQRYVSMARAIAAMRKFSNDPTAYNFEFHEGAENPVIAYMHRNDNDTTIATAESNLVGVVNE